MAYLPLSTANLPEPTISPADDASPSDYFGTLIWSGNDTGTTRTIAEGQSGITGDVNFTPDFVWAKARSSAYSHVLYDTVRGLGANKELISDQTNSEGGGNPDRFGYVSSMTTGGFVTTAGSDGATQNLYFNNSGDTYVAWNWKANGSGVSNTDGSITSTVSANTEAGFSVGTFVGNQTAGATVGHGLSQAPEMIIIKDRPTVNDWPVYHASISPSQTIKLNSANAAFTESTIWNNTAPTTSVFTLGSSNLANNNTKSHVFYAFHSVESFSSFGSYQGNGGGGGTSGFDGPFVYTGFRPSFVLVKNADAGWNWIIWDDERDPYNQVNGVLQPNSSNAEYDVGGYMSVDFLSNGFKIRSNDAQENGNGNTHIYMAFSANPFKYSTGF